MSDPRNAQAYKMIVDSGREGVTFKDLEAVHLQGQTSNLLRSGLVSRRLRKSDGKKVYIALDKVR